MNEKIITQEERDLWRFEASDECGTPSEEDERILRLLNALETTEALLDGSVQETRANFSAVYQACTEIIPELKAKLEAADVRAKEASEGQIAMPAQNPCPNPKCGSNDVWSTSAGHDFWIYCNKCLLTGPIAESECAAIDAWDSLPRMHSIIAWQFQAAGAALALQRLIDAAQAMREAQQAYEQHGSNEDSVAEAEAVFDGLLADVRRALE